MNYTSQPLTLDEMRAKVEWLGKFVNTHAIGPYAFVEFHPRSINGDGVTVRGVYETHTHFAGFVDGRSMNESFLTLDGALAGAIAYRREGGNHHADQYFMKGMGL